MPIREPVEFDAAYQSPFGCLALRMDGDAIVQLVAYASPYAVRQRGNPAARKALQAVCAYIESGDSAGRIHRTDEQTVQVASTNGTLRVFDARGIQVANVVAGGDALAFTLQVAGASPPSSLIGCLLKKDGKYLNGMLDKSVWVKWMELRIHGDAEALDAGYGLIPKYDDLKKIFKDVLNKDFTEQDYVDQFTIRIPELLAKLDRMEEIYATVDDTPQAMKDEMAAQRKRLEALKADKGDYISPLDLA